SHQRDRRSRLDRGRRLPGAAGQHQHRAAQGASNDESHIPSPRQTKAPQSGAFGASDGLVDLGGQLATGVALEHAYQGDRLDLGVVTGGAEGFVAGDADVAHGVDGLGEELARVELARVLGHHAADGTGGGQTQVGVDVDLAHAVLDAFYDL